MYQIFFSKTAYKDTKLLSSKMKEKLKNSLLVISEDPFIGKKLVGSLDGNYSYRLNIKDRVVYSIDEEKKCIFIKRTRTHYGE